MAERCLITGASSGIGAALARRMAKRGIEVWLAARRVGALEETVRSIEADGGRAHAFALDVARAEETEARGRRRLQSSEPFLRAHRRDARRAKPRCLSSPCDARRVGALEETVRSIEADGDAHAPSRSTWPEPKRRSARVRDLDERVGGLDTVMANAGIGGGTTAVFSILTLADARRILDTNLVGALATILPLVPRMVARGRGHIVGVSSLAAEIPASCGCALRNEQSGPFCSSSNRRRPRSPPQSGVSRHHRASRFRAYAADRQEHVRHAISRRSRRRRRDHRSGHPSARAVRPLSPSSPRGDLGEQGHASGAPRRDREPQSPSRRLTISGSPITPRARAPMRHLGELI